MLVTLRPYQLDAVEQSRNKYREGFRAPLVVLSTGAGKTVIFCHITELVAKNKKRVVILVHRQELLRQTSEHLGRLGVSHGLIAPGHSMTGDCVQIASVQTLVRRIDRIPAPDLIVIDEAHHTNASTWRKVIDTWDQSRVLGVTATPCRLDGTGLGVHCGGYFDSLIEGPTIRELIDAGYLSQPIVYAPPSGIDLSSIHTRMGDYVQSEIEQAFDKPKITGSAIEHYLRLCPNVPAIAFCASVKHAEHVADEFSTAGITSVSLDGTMPDSVRKYRIEALGNGQIKVLTSCSIVSEGTDIPAVTAAILLRPTQSLGLFLQQVGRCLRPCPSIGKTHAIILDHVGNCLRHGLPDEIREWSLEGEKKRKRKKNEDEPKVRQCEKCYAVFPLTVTICPQCGTPVEIKKRDPLKQVQGDLVQMNPEQVAILRKNMRQEQGLAQSLEDLIRVGKARGYHPGWAQRVYNARMDKQRKTRESRAELSFAS